MGLSGAFWCGESVACFRICSDSAVLEALHHAPLLTEMSPEEDRAVVLERRMGSLRIQTGRTLQGRCCQVEQLPPVQLWQTDYAVTTCKNKVASLPWRCASHRLLSQTKVHHFHCSPPLSRISCRKFSQLWVVNIISKVLWLCVLHNCKGNTWRPGLPFTNASRTNYGRLYQLLALLADAISNICLMRQSCQQL